MQAAAPLLKEISKHKPEAQEELFEDPEELDQSTPRSRSLMEQAAEGVRALGSFSLRLPWVALRCAACPCHAFHNLCVDEVSARELHVALSGVFARIWQRQQSMSSLDALIECLCCKSPASHSSKVEIRMLAVQSVEASLPPRLGSTLFA